MNNKEKTCPVRNKKSTTSIISNGNNIIFFGTSEFAVGVLEQLKISDGISGGLASRYLPKLIITTPEKPSGRKLKLTPPPVKIWADENNIPTLQPEKLDEKFSDAIKNFSSNFSEWDLFIVAAYGKIIPQKILDLPKHGTINVHPSLLPKFRGATPIHNAILEGEQETGVSIILLDEQMDHGPIIVQEKFTLWKNSISEIPPQSELEKQLAILGGQMLTKIIPQWIAGKITVQEQNHQQATYTQKLKPNDSLIDLNNDPELNFRKIQAFSTWPKAHLFQSGKRIIIKKAHLNQGELIIDKVIPEGGKEINYSDLLK